MKSKLLLIGIVLLFSSCFVFAVDFDYTIATPTNVSFPVTIGTINDLNDGDFTVNDVGTSFLTENSYFQLDFGSSYIITNITVRQITDGSGAAIPCNISVYVGTTKVLEYYFDGADEPTPRTFTVLPYITGSYVRTVFHNLDDTYKYIRFDELEVYGTKTSPIIIANATTPDPALPTQDWQINITAIDDDNATFTAWTQFYINATSSGGEINQAINNDTNTRIANLSAASIHDGDALIAEIWVGDGESNSTRTNISSLSDVTAPTISPDTIDLNLTFVYLNNNITGQINASDPNLYSINVSIDTTSIFNTSGYDSSLYVYNLSQNVSSFGEGNHNLSIRVCDGHTSASLKDEWDYAIGLNGLTFTDNDKWYRINPTNNDIFESISTTRLYDRYTFEYSKSVIGKLLTGDTYTFVVESSEYIDIIDNRPQGKYEAWMVIPSMERWIDFNLKDVPDAKYVVTRLKNNQVKVEISNIPKGIDKLVFESTGELNCITETYEFYVFDYTLTHDLTVLETSNQSFVLEITTNSLIDYANTTLIWNGTIYNPTNITTDGLITFTQYITMPEVVSDENFLFNWHFNVTGNSTTTINTSNFNQTVYGIDFDDCSTYNVTALNFSLIVEDDNSSIAGDMEFTFTLVGEAVTINYSKSVTGVNSTRFCISTNEVNFTAQLHSEYSATGYDAHTYFAYNLGIDNTINYVYYYLTNDTTIVEFTVRNHAANAIENAYIKVMKYDIGTGAYHTIEVLKTDELGKALGHIILDTVWYKFIVEYEGITYLDTSPTKMTSTTRTFTINLLSDFFDRYTDVIYNIYSTLNYTYSTGNIAFTYSDADGDYEQGCLKVTKNELFGNTLIGETCVESTAATILVNINNSGSVNGTYTAVGYILFEDGDKYVLKTWTETWGHLSDKYGIEGLFYAFLIVLTVVMVGIFSPKLAIILGVIGLVFTNILGFIFIEWGWLVSIIIAAGLTLYRMRDM